MSCSRITQHATVKAPPNKRPDASWSSGPDKYLPKESELQTPEAAAAAKAVIKKVLESRMSNSDSNEKNKKVISKSLGSKKPVQKPAERNAEPVLSSASHHLNSNARNETTAVEERAAKERFMNALARFQISTSAHSGELRRSIDRFSPAPNQSHYIFSFC